MKKLFAIVAALAIYGISANAVAWEQCDAADHAVGYECIDYGDAFKDTHLGYMYCRTGDAKWCAGTTTINNQTYRVFRCSRSDYECSDWDDDAYKASDDGQEEVIDKLADKEH